MFGDRGGVHYVDKRGAGNAMRIKFVMGKRRVRAEADEDNMCLQGFHFSSFRPFIPVCDFLLVACVDLSHCPHDRPILFCMQCILHDL